MVKSRYFYCLFLMNSLINIINFVPRELMDRRFDGALMSILIAVPVGTAFVYVFTKLMDKFPGKGIPEIFNSLMPRLVSTPMLLIYGVLWYVAGVITLLSFVDITLRFISPDTGAYPVVIGFLILVCLCCRVDGLSLLYTLEVILGITVPLILYASVKALTNPNFSWDSVLQIMTFIWHKPDIKSMAAGTFLFSGYINLAIFNRLFHKIKIRHVWLIAVEGLIVLLMTFLVPIGYFGTIGVERHVYTWFSTADSIRIETFLIERMLFIFYFAYMTLSIMSVIVHWHVGLELFKSIMPFADKNSSKVKLWKEWIILGLFCVATLLLMFMDQYELNRLAEWFLQIRWLGEMSMIATLFYCVIKMRKARRRNP
ncbi:hypothetical protein A8L34_25550 [Bacillus sp. FJAT-27264]|uniref:GerAB/ArcD/ProY family transporter n=1 Tax=Paenibacillus sp. (strain DSM 101736 / FJAT-27264) TaxID=1850362 RepID=UPI00080805C0|nr:GerAB/ArcD/ProY family transporter [Bacillus sp. FJAT-27264]OBZ07991.1 hypothetical protein A8L34_25550 [Bacillus sp. FJAT-27264]